MTRTTVYKGQPWEDDHEVLADLFHNHDYIQQCCDWLEIDDRESRNPY